MSSPELSARSFKLSEIIGALSFALDITDGQPPGHAVRSCMIGLRIASELHLDDEQRAAAFYGMLMKDAGCSSNAAAVAALYGTDDLAAKAAVRTINYSRISEGLRYIVKNAGGTRDLLRVLRAGKQTARAMTEIRCERGADIALMLDLPAGAADAIASLGEHWDGKGHPRGLHGDEIPLLARIFKLAQTVEVFVADFGIDAAVAMAHDRSGTWFDPHLVGVFAGFANDTAFWQRVSGDPETLLRDLEPTDRPRVADDVRLDRIAEAFALVIDAKSPFTFEHSSRVAALAVAAAAELGLDSDAQRDLRRAGLLHDIGKLAISSRILDKPGALTDDERASIERHPQLSEQILDRVPAFATVARLAGRHHERLDGSGYWRGADAGELSIADRILAVADVYEAMTAARPYRPAKEPEVAMRILAEEADAGRLCHTATRALISALERESWSARPSAARPSLIAR